MINYEKAIIQICGDEDYICSSEHYSIKIKRNDKIVKIEFRIKGANLTFTRIIPYFDLDEEKLEAVINYTLSGFINSLKEQISEELLKRN